MLASHIEQITRDVPQAWLTSPLYNALYKVESSALYTSTVPVKYILQPLRYFEPQACRVVILGQDPYHQPHKANGLAFGVSPFYDWTGRDSLERIMKESGTRDSTLESWAEQGVLLLNSYLTVKENKPLSHRHVGWTEVVRAILDTLPSDVVWLAMGASAKRMVPRDKVHRTIEVDHPSPINTNSNFLGSNVFERTNQLLDKPINWSTESYATNFGRRT